MIATAKAVKLLSFSGYIRNYRALCEELDVPVNLERHDREKAILEASYAKWGMGMTEHIYGAFAFAVSDEKAGRLYIVRDHVGQKQMFYAELDGEPVWSGDINKIAADPRYKKRLNKRMLELYLFYGYPIGSETFYEGIYKLMPGTYAEWDGRSFTLHTYSKPVFTPDRSKSVEEYAKEIQETVGRIMAEEKGDADLPYKESFLSGGVDSSYLLAAGDAACANTIGYDESGYDESALARETAELLHRGFRVKQIGPEEYFDRIPETIAKLGQPLGDASAVAFSLGCKAVREHATVVYSGEGIDEFFGGYNAHSREMPEEWTYLTCSHIMSVDAVKALVKDCGSVDILKPIAGIWSEVQGQDTLSKRLSVDIALWLEGDIYLNTDRTSTACGVELHTPFSDQRLYELAKRIPSEYKLMNGMNKYVFRSAARSLLPEESAFRKKVGFPVPVRAWLADERYNAPVREKLFGESSKELFNAEEVKDMWDRFTGGESALWNRVYAIYVLLLWYDICFKGET